MNDQPDLVPVLLPREVVDQHAQNMVMAPLNEACRKAVMTTEVQRITIKGDGKWGTGGFWVTPKTTLVFMSDGSVRWEPPPPDYGGSVMD